MEMIQVDITKCKGCFYCVEACPTNAVAPSGKTSPDGYPTISVDQEKCIRCASCYRMCPDYVFEILY